MIRKILLSTAVILLLSSGVFASIGHVQGFSIVAFNKPKIVSGFGLASGQNHLVFGQAKSASDICLGSASMSQGGILSQQACVGGLGRPKVVQNATVAGLQGQLIVGGRYGRGFRAQGQCLTLNLNTKANKTGGFGGAAGSQSFAGGQSQRQTYRGGYSSGSQFVCAEQSVNILGGGCGGKKSGDSNVVVNNNLDVTMFQGSIAK